MKTCETCGQRWLVIHRCDDSETAKQDQEMQRLQIVTPDRTECEHGGLKRKCRTCELEAELRQWNTEFPGGLGQAQQAKHMAIAAVKAIGAVYEETSSTDIAEAVASRDAEIERLNSDIAHAVNEGKKYQPDYPWTQNNASEVAWALGQSCMGIRWAGIREVSRGK